MRSFVRKVRNKLRQKSHLALRAAFPYFEKLGIHVTPVHFYSPIPDLRQLPPSTFKRISECVGIEWDAPAQLALLNEKLRFYSNEGPQAENEGLSGVDSAILHAMIRHFKPRKIIEVGAGQSSLIIARANELNAKADGHRGEFVSIEPYLNDHLRKIFPSGVRLVEAKLEDVPIESITDSDLLFIDSSHVVRIGGDVNREILDILPRMKAGAIVHFHDILLPAEYWEDWVVENKFFWTEQYLLQAFLQFNSAFEILWASSYMHLNHPEKIRSAYPFFDPKKHRITSFWIRRKPL